MLDIRIVSPLEKVFLDTAPAAAKPLFSGFQNEHIFFQLAYTCSEELNRKPARLVIESPLGADLCARAVKNVPVLLPTLADADDNYLRKTPGLYPDLLQNPRGDNPNGESTLLCGLWQSYWLEYAPARPAPAGDYPLTLRLCGAEGETLAQAAVTLRILPGLLPPQTLKRTQWFHADCLADYYGVPAWSERHWQIVESFMRTAARRGINMILTPLFTPPLDTAVGAERTTVQLVDVTQDENGWRFGFDRLRRWVQTARRAGMQYFEMSHLFSQWGALHAPKVVDTRGARLFGWETDARGPQYAAFLHAFLPALMRQVHDLGIFEQTYFHISDEPHADQMEQYRAVRALVAPYVEGRPIMDAMSDFSLYQSGAVSHPIPAINHLQPFLDAGVPDLWTYYCISQYKDVSNQFIAMPGARTRMLGVQLYKYRLQGFLQWGYNFYNARLSAYRVDPYAVTDGDGAFPGGDPFAVYPGPDGQPQESLRLLLLHMAMQDLRALQAAEARIGRKAVLRLIDQAADGPLTLTDYPRDAAFFDRLRETVNAAIIHHQKEDNKP